MGTRYWLKIKNIKKGKCQRCVPGMHRTENDNLSRGYQSIASCIVKLFNSCVSMMPPAVLNVPAVKLLTNML